MAVKDSTQFFIEQLLNAVSIEINYKNDIFLEQSSAYKHLTSKNLGSRNVNSPKYNPNHKVLYEAKRKVTFADVKLDFISSDQQDLLKQLEDKYVSSKVADAGAADDILSDDSKDAIADAVVAFILEVNDVKTSMVKKLDDSALKKVGKNMCLVYQNGISKPYQFPALAKALQVIAEETIKYCENMPAIKSKSGKKRDHIAPLFIRKTCALVCYTLIDAGNYISIKLRRKPVGSITGVSKQIMADLHSRCCDLKYPYFKNENKLFQSDKWSILPDKMLRKDSYIAPLSPISYAGLKQGYLGFMISKLQKQVPYKVFLDAFGGSGISIVQFPHQTGVKYYVNDFHYANVCYYKMLKSSEDEFDIFLDCLEEIREVVKKAVENVENGTWTRKQFNNAIGKLYNIYDAVSDVCVNVSSKNYVTSNGVYSDFVSAMQNINSKFNPVNYNADTIIAAIFTAFANMTVNGKIADNVIGNTKGFTDKTNKAVFKKEFTSLRQCYRDVEIVAPDGASAMRLLQHKNFNKPETLVYLDSPYIGTMEYNASQNSNSICAPKGINIPADGNNFISNDFDMEALLDRCDNFLGKFIFSCRINMPNPEPVFVVTQIPQKENGRVLSKNNIHLHFNNYIWFFKRWLSMKDIDNCYVLFMVDTDWNLLKEPLYYDPDTAILDNWKMAVDEVFKEKFVSTDWGMEIDVVTKGKIFDYLRAIILMGYNLEIMITNYDFEVPLFDNMFEHIYNVYDKRTETFQSKTTAKGKISEKRNVELLIPDNGMFVKIPMKLVAELVLNTFQIIKRTFKL